MLCGHCKPKKLEGTNIEVTMRGPTGGGSNNLNSISKNEDSGTFTLAADGVISVKINHNYKIVNEGDGGLFLESILILKRNGQEDVRWKRKNKVNVNEKIVEHPFEGVTLEIMSTYPTLN